MNKTVFNMFFNILPILYTVITTFFKCYFMFVFISGSSLFLIRLTI